MTGIKQLVLSLAERWATLDKATRITVAVALVESAIEAVKVEVAEDAKRAARFDDVRFKLQRMEAMLSTVLGLQKPGEQLP